MASTNEFNDTDSKIEALEAEAWRRAVDGVEGAAGTRKYSDTLLMFLLRAHRPELYGTRGEGDDKDDAPVIGRVTLYLPDNGRDDTVDPEPAPGDDS